MAKATVPVSKRTTAETAAAFENAPSDAPAVEQIPIASIERDGALNWHAQGVNTTAVVEYAYATREGALLSEAEPLKRNVSAAVAA